MKPLFSPNHMEDVTVFLEINIRQLISDKEMEEKRF